MMRMRVESVCAPLMVLFILCRVVLAETDQTLPKDDERNNHKAKEGNDLTNLVDFAVGSKSPHGGGDAKFLIPPRHVRRLGSEFLGKRSDMPMNEGKARIQKRRAMGSEFLGKRRAMGSEFLGKRGFQTPHIEDYVLSSSETTGPDWIRPNDPAEGYIGDGRVELIQKNSNSLGRTSDYIAKRRNEYPAWKQSLNSRLIQFDKKRRAMGSEFLGKRSLHGAEQLDLTEYPADKTNF